VTSCLSYDDDAPLLLVTSFSPSEQGGGAVIIRSLLEGNENRVVWASPVPDGTGYAGRVARIDLGRHPWFTPPALAAERILQLAMTESAVAIWAVAHGPIVPCLAALADRSRLPLHLSVHDDPAWSVAFRGRRQRVLSPWLHQRFGRGLEAAASLDAIGGGMRAWISRRSGRESVIVHRVVEGPIAANRVAQADDVLTVGLLGNLYASRQFEQLISALAHAASLLKMAARLLVVGGANRRMHSAAAGRDVAIEFTGHLPERDGIERLRGAFAMYVGYPFGSRDRVLRRTSFPAKIATYVQIARPLLVHAPFDSSLTPLFGVQPYVIPWIDEDEKHGGRLLARAWVRGELHESQHRAAELVRATYFGSDNRDRLFRCLNAHATNSSGRTA
jgi:hypothetical protein